MIDQTFIDNLRAQKITWRQLGYNPLMHRELLSDKNGPFIGPDVISSLIDNGSLEGSVLQFLNPNQLTTGKITASSEISIGSSGGKGKLQLDGKNKRIIVYDETGTARVIIGYLKDGF